jgi:hypothetical protein
MGVPEQFNGELFRSSENLDSLPQIVHEVLDINVSSFWGENEICDVGITRADFDLRNFGIDIQPHAIFMGSFFSSNEDDYIKGNCKPKNDTGKLCDSITGIGKILAIRQTTVLDENGHPVLEQYPLPEGGYVIDENGTWLIEIPMNLEYQITDEFGNQIISNDPSKGIPTQGKYRFKISWDVESGLSNEIQRASYLVPNIKEHGWVNGVGTSLSQIPEDRNSSYAFSLSWDEYYDVQSAIKCEDTFYNFYYNKVYTVASHIDRFKWGRGRQKHIGIKEINDKSCQSENNRFPINDAQRNGNLLIFLFNFLFMILTPTFIIMLSFAHVLAFIWNLFIGIIDAINWLVKKVTFGSVKELIPLPDLENPFKSIPLPMLTYPDCETCACENSSTDISSETGNSLSSNENLLSDSSLPGFSKSSTYFNSNGLCGGNLNNEEAKKVMAQVLYSGYDGTADKFYEDVWGGTNDDVEWYKSPVYPVFNNDSEADIDGWYLGANPTYAQGLNLMNRRSQYFAVNYPMTISINLRNEQFGAQTSGTLYDLPLVIVTKEKFEAGQLLTFNNPNNFTDPNLGKVVPTLHSTDGYVTKTIKGVKNNPYTEETYEAELKIYNPYSTTTYNKSASVEYFQVISAFTFNEIEALVNYSDSTAYSVIRHIIMGWGQKYGCTTDQAKDAVLESSHVVPNYIPNFKSEYYITVLVRGVDVHTPRQDIEYNLSKLFGRSNENWYDFEPNVTVRGQYFLNIPIQKNTNYSGTTPRTDIWWDSYKTPSPHHMRNFTVNNDLLFVNSANNNTSVDFTTDLLFPYMDLPNLWNESYTMMFPEDEWIPFSTKATNRYVSVDKSLTYVTTLNDFPELFDSGEVNMVNVQNNLISNSFQQNIEGCGFQYSKNNEGGDNRKVNTSTEVVTFSTLYFGDNPTIEDPYGGDQPKTALNYSSNLIFRSDRIPASDVWDEPYREDVGTGDMFLRRYALHLNNNFTIFAISDEGQVSQVLTDTPNQQFGTSDGSGEGEDTSENEADYGSEYASSVLDSFSCEGMVPLACYQGSGEDFEVVDPCDLPGPVESNERVVNGCYNFVVKNVLLTLFRDIEMFFEYRSRIKFMFSICQGIIGEMFQNNWVNGVLYYPSFQKKTFFNSDNEVSRYKYCGDPGQPNDDLKFQGPIYFNTNTNTFYYRSTPFNDVTGKFIGQQSTRYDRYRTNKKNIWFPTTIMDLGPKDKYLQELVLSDVFGEYIMDKLRTTTYAENSNLVNLFVISRLRNAGFWEQALGLGDASMQRIFSRDDQSFFDSRIDGDFAQMVSINSEIGVSPFLEADYRNDQMYVGENTIGIWYESDVNLRRILTNGVSTFGSDPEGPTNTFGYENTQVVPYYMWKVNNNGELFGTNLNTWTTDTIYSSKYQGDDFFYSPIVTPITYMKPDSGYGLGYIYNRSIADETYSLYPVTDTNNENYKVGAPFHFYFGLKRGKSALNRFIKKYITVESV